MLVGEAGGRRLLHRVWGGRRQLQKMLVYRFNNCLFIGCSPVGLVNDGPVGSRSSVIWVHSPWVEAIEFGVLDVWSKPFPPQGEAGSWRFPPNVGAVAQGGVCGEGASQLFLPVAGWVFSVLCNVYESLNLSPDLSQRESICIECILGVSMGGGKFGSLLCCHLGEDQEGF